MTDEVVDLEEPGRKKRAKGFERSIPGEPPARRRRLGEPPKQWNPEYAARIPWYPKTPEAFARWQQAGRERMARLRAEGRFPTRRGVPDGFGGRKQRALEARERARAEAKEIVAHMAKKDLIDREDPRAEEALESLIEIVRAKDEAMDAPLYKAAERIQAAKAVLEFTKQKPVARADLNVRKAEDFLAAVAEDMKNG